MAEKSTIQTQESSVDDIREHVGESFNIYQASIAMIAIFDGFLFASLVQFLSVEDAIELTGARKLEIWLLTFALLGFTYAMLCFHLTAHQVIRRWGFFYPKNQFVKVGGRLMNLSLLFMFSALAVMLWGKHMFLLAVLFEVGVIGIVIFVVVTKRKLRHGKHIVSVDQ
jgi:hypothetical protein